MIQVETLVQYIQEMSRSLNILRKYASFPDLPENIFTPKKYKVCILLLINENHILLLYSSESLKDNTNIFVLRDYRMKE